MSFKVHEHDGAWAVSRDGENVVIIGGDEIGYEDYVELKDKPHRAKDKFERDTKGKLVAKPKPKDLK